MGFPGGKFCNLVGDKSTGKSFLASEIVAAAYHTHGKKQFRWVYDDCEAGYTFDSKNMYGFEIQAPEQIIASTTVEEAFVNIANFAADLKKDQCGIYVLDSLDGLTSDEQDDQASARIKAVNAGKSMDKGSYNMGKPKYLSREFFPQLCSLIQDKNILVVIVSQVRENIAPFSFEKYTRSGGKAMDFYAHTVLWLAVLKKIVKKGRTVGVVIKAKTTKSKTPRPFRDCAISLIFDYGIDDIGSNLDFLFSLRTDKGELTPAAKAVAWGEGAAAPTLATVRKFLKKLKYDPPASLKLAMEFIDEVNGLREKYDAEFGGGGVVMPRDKLITYIEENNLEGELKRRVVEKWEALEKEIATSRKKRYGGQPEGRE